MSSLSRREVLKRTGAGLATLGVLSACTPLATPTPVPSATAARPGAAATEQNATDHAAMPPVQEGGATPTLSMREQVDEMDAMHEARVNYFVENAGKDPLFWGNRLEPTLDGDVKVFTLECSEIDWLLDNEQTVKALAYNGTVPGPEIRITEGDTVRVVITNNLTESTAIHFHGVRVPVAMDGVPFITQPPIKPGETFTYEFVARNPGSHMYHSHLNAAVQVTRGLLGPFIIEPRDKSNEPEYDSDYTMILNDSGIGLTINGRSFPSTQPILAKLGERVRVRYMNEGLMIHPMHLHGLIQQVIAKDGWPMPQPFLCDTLNIAPGERYDVIIECDEPGVWAYHCHILSHAESPQGMFGMVTTLIVSEET